MFTGSEVSLRDLRDCLERELRDSLGVGADVELVEPLSLERSTGKAKRVVDLRNNLYI